jgi:hypothetical protein
MLCFENELPLLQWMTGTISKLPTRKSAFNRHQIAQFFAEMALIMN